MRPADGVPRSVDVDVLGGRRHRWMERVGGWRGGGGGPMRGVGRQCGSFRACSRVVSMSV